MLTGSMVEKLPMIGFIIWFVIYLISHIVIGIFYDIAKKKTPKVIISKEDKDLQQNEKILKIIFNWWPAAVIILFVISNL